MVLVSLAGAAWEVREESSPAPACAAPAAAGILACLNQQEHLDHLSEHAAPGVHHPAAASDASHDPALQSVPDPYWPALLDRQCCFPSLVLLA